MYAFSILEIIRMNGICILPNKNLLVLSQKHHAHHSSCFNNLNKSTSQTGQIQHPLKSIQRITAHKNSIIFSYNKNIFLKSSIFLTQKQFTLTLYSHLLHKQKYNEVKPRLCRNKSWGNDKNQRS